MYDVVIRDFKTDGYLLRRNSRASDIESFFKRSKLQITELERKRYFSSTPASGGKKKKGLRKKETDRERLAN